MQNLILFRRRGWSLSLFLFDPCITRTGCAGIKLGTDYPCPRAGFTGRGQKWHPCSPAVSAREHGPWTRVVCTELKSYSVFPRKDVSSCGTADTAPHLGGGSYPAKTIRVVNRHFQAKVAKYWSLHITEITTSITTKFYTVIKTPKYFTSGWNTCTTNPRWRTTAILKNRENRHNSATVWPITTKFGKVTQIAPLNPIGS